ncbi:ankyrin repeat-containing domain protein [Lactarius psammicola]|nr:ankyrin repeat-containing domain protein [Lactarius psammicola]
MSQHPLESPSPSSFESIFRNALNAYKKRTGQDITSHPSAACLKTCNSPDAILAVLRAQVQKFDKSRRDDERLIKWLNPTVNVLYAFSAILGEGIGLVFSPAKVIFAGFGVLLLVSKDITASHDVLVDIFERIENFFRHLVAYSEVPPTEAMTDYVDDKVKHIGSQVEGVNKGVQDVDERVQGVDGSVQGVGRKVRAVDDRVKQVDDRVDGLSNSVTNPARPKAYSLYYAVRTGHRPLVEHVFSKCPQYVNAMGGYYGTPLHAALFKGDVEVVWLLLDKGADVNIQGLWDQTPLLHASAADFPDIVRWLLGRGVDVNAQQDDQSTALHLAAYNGRLEIAEILLKHNAEVNARDDVGRVPLRDATRRGHLELVQLLSKYDGEPERARQLWQDSG